MSEKDKAEKASALELVGKLRDTPIRSVQRFYTLRMREEAPYSLWILRLDKTASQGRTAITSMMSLVETGFAESIGMEVRQDHAPRAGNVKEMQKYIKSRN